MAEGNLDANPKLDGAPLLSLLESEQREQERLSVMWIIDDMKFLSGYSLEPADAVAYMDHHSLGGKSISSGASFLNTTPKGGSYSHLASLHCVPFERQTPHTSPDPEAFSQKDSDPDRNYFNRMFVWHDFLNLMQDLTTDPKFDHITTIDTCPNMAFAESLVRHAGFAIMLSKDDQDLRYLLGNTDQLLSRLKQRGRTRVSVSRSIREFRERDISETTMYQRLREKLNERGAVAMTVRSFEQGLKDRLSLRELGQRYDRVHRTLQRIQHHNEEAVKKPGISPLINTSVLGPSDEFLFVDRHDYTKLDPKTLKPEDVYPGIVLHENTLCVAKRSDLEEKHPLARGIVESEKGTYQVWDYGVPVSLLEEEDGDFRIIFQGVAKYVDNLHARGFEHFDIKPEHICAYPSYDDQCTYGLLDLDTARQGAVCYEESGFLTEKYTHPNFISGKIDAKANDTYAFVCTFLDYLRAHTSYFAQTEPWQKVPLEGAQAHFDQYRKAIDKMTDDRVRQMFLDATMNPESIVSLGDFVQDVFQD